MLWEKKGANIYHIITWVALREHKKKIIMLRSRLATYDGFDICNENCHAFAVERDKNLHLTLYFSEQSKSKKKRKICGNFCANVFICHVKDNFCLDC